MSTPPLAPTEEEARLARARQRHANTERGLRGQPPSDFEPARDELQSVTSPRRTTPRRLLPGTATSSFGIPSSSVGYLAVFGVLTMYALLGFIGYTGAVGVLLLGLGEVVRALSGG